jgi:hypothetical protein
MAVAKLERPLGSWSSDQVGAWLSNLGAAFQGYRGLPCANGVDGELFLTLVGLSDDEADRWLTDLGITTQIHPTARIHRKAIHRRLQQLFPCAVPTS